MCVQTSHGPYISNIVKDTKYLCTSCDKFHLKKDIFKISNKCKYYGL